MKHFLLITGETVFFYIGQWWPFILLLFIPFVVYLSFHSLTGLSRWRNRCSLILRILLLLLLILALAEIQVVRKSNLLKVLFLLDVSKSVPVSIQEKALTFIQNAMKQMDSQHDRAGLLIFGRDASFEFVDQKAGYSFSQIQSQVDPEQTDIAGALKLAMAQLADEGQRRIVLLSDGNQTIGDCLREAEQAKAYHIPIDVVPFLIGSDREVVLQKLSAPSEVNERQAYEISAVVVSSQQTTGTLYLQVNGELVREKTLAFVPGKNSVTFTIPAHLVQPGFQKIRVIVESPDDGITANNMAESFTYIYGTPKILYLESDLEHRDYLYNALTNLSLTSQRRMEVVVGGPEDIPRDIVTLHSYDALILSNISRNYLDETQMKMIENAVKESGMGLIMIGGEHSFGAGGYHGTPIERALPVDMDIKHKKVVPNGALVLILHTCEFPEGNEWAKLISKKAIEMLTPMDLAGILHYSWQSRESWIFPLMEVTKNNKNRMFQLIDAASPGDMPSFETTLQAAQVALLPVPDGKKHIVIITDGDPVPPTVTLMQQIKDARISISGIVIHPHDAQDTERMRYICHFTGGRYYLVSNPEALPAIFAREALTIKRNLIFESEKGFTPTLAYHSDMLRGLGNAGFPKLYGYVLTTAKSLAQVPLYIPQDDQKDPLLAYMHYGLGRTVAYTSDAKNRWAAPWVSWPEYQKFWVQVVQWSLRKLERSNFLISTSFQQGKGKIAIDAVSPEGEWIPYLDIQGAAVAPNGNSYTFPIQQTGLGRYEGEFPVNQVGVYLITAIYQQEGKTKHLTTGLSVSYSAEFLNSGPDLTLLSKLASLSGGRVLSLMPSSEAERKQDIFLHGLPQRGHPQDIWPFLLTLFLILFPLDVFLRRVILDYQKLWYSISAYFSLGRREEADAPATMAVLKQTAQAIRETMEERRTNLSLKQLEQIGLQSKELQTSPLEKESLAKKSSEQRHHDAQEQITQEETKIVQEDSYTDRLLQAKKHAWKKHKKTKE